MQKVKVRLIPEDGEGHRLGRHVEHDPRSRAFPFEAPTELKLRTVRHRRHARILNQGDLGSCTGNACVGALACEPIYGRLPEHHRRLDETEAVALYAAATAIDDVPGTYPPTDTGSSGLAVAKAARSAGMIRSYTHAFGLDHVLRALMRGPVLIGINWYSSFDRPAEDGTIAIADQAWVRGGHELVLNEYDADRPDVAGDNSWGVSWGLHGRFRLGLDTLARLLDEDGDATVLTPLPEQP